MPKWVSPIFSDIRNAIGENVVFSQWKGRPYFRTYVKPAQPRTNPQKAHRAVFEKLMKRAQQIMADSNVKAAWAKRALEYLITAFNVFMKFGRASWIKVTPTSGTAPVTVTIEYKCGIPLSEARVYLFDGASWSDITPSEGLSESGSFTHELSSAGTYEFYLATNAVLKEGDTSPQAYQAVTKWYPDETNGVAGEAKCEVS